MEGDPVKPLFAQWNPVFQSTPSAWRETVYLVENHKFRIISIHSLRMEGDSRFRWFSPLRANFNPLPPHGGRPRR